MFHRWSCSTALWRILFVPHSDSAHSLPPQDMRNRHACPCTILCLQIHYHARREEERCAGKHLHSKGEEERPHHVVCVESTAGETARDVCENEEDSSVSGVIRPAEEAWVSKGGDLGVPNEYTCQWWDEMALFTTAPVIMVVLSSARPTPMARLTCPAWAKDNKPTIARALGPVSSRGSPDRATSATTRINSAWMKVVRISQPLFRVRTLCASCPNTKLPMMKLRSVC